MGVKSFSRNTTELIVCLAEERLKQGLSQKYVAEKAGIDQSQLSRIESLESDPKLDTLIGIARALGKDLEIK